MGKSEGGRNGQAVWPEKSCKLLLELLKNAESNAKYRGLNSEIMYIRHVQVNKAKLQSRRTFRAHGRSNPFASKPCQIELILEEKVNPVQIQETLKKTCISNKKPDPSILKHNTKINTCV